jgi:hypothetical protein
MDAAACTSLFTAIRPSYEGVEALAAAGPDGDVFCTSDRKEVRDPLPPIRDRYYFRQAMAVVFVSLGLDWLAAKLDRDEGNQDQAFSLVDFQGTILVRQPYHSRFVGKSFPSWDMVQSRQPRRITTLPRRSRA